MIWRQSLKCVFDAVMVFSALVFLPPVDVLVALLVRARLECPIMFKQDRPGKDAVLFRILKFLITLDANVPHGKSMLGSERLIPSHKGKQPGSNGPMFSNQRGVVPVENGLSGIGRRFA